VAPQPDPEEADALSITGLVEHTDGRPFGGVPITVTDDTGEPVDVLTSGDDGRFEVPVDSGSYIVIASPEGCQPDARRVFVPPSVEGAAAGASVEFVLDGDGLLYGRVAGAGEGVLTLLDAAGSVVAATDIDEDGSYEIAGLRSGVYTLTAVVPGMAPAALPVLVEPGDAREYDLGLGPAEFLPDEDFWDAPAGSNGDDASALAGQPVYHQVAFVRGGTGIADLPQPSQPVEAQEHNCGVAPEGSGEDN
jgi:hypothetical protein